nr:hypothetical protein [Tanacetum cinerariifolium]
PLRIIGREISQPLLVVPSPVPSSDDLYLTVGHAHTPATVDTKSEPEEAPRRQRSLRLLSHQTLGSPHHIPQLHRIPSHHCHLITHLLRLHPPLYRPEFCSTIGPHIWPSISSYETPSPSSSPTLPIRKRYQGTSELVEDTEEESLYSYDERDRSEDEGPGLEEGGEEATPEGQQQAVLAEDTTVDEPLGLGYGALRCRELSVGEGKMPTTFEVGQSSRSVSEHDGTERISAFRQPTLVTWVDPEDGRVYTDILTYVLPVAHVHTPPSLEWSSGSLPVSPSSLAVPTSVGAVRDEIFSQRYRLRSLEPEQERATRPILALEAWAGQTDAQRAALWHAIYYTQKENHDLRMQIAKERNPLRIIGREISQPLLVVPSPVPSSDDLYLTVGHAHTPATVDTKSEPEEAPRRQRSLRLLSHQTLGSPHHIPQLHRIPSHHCHLITHLLRLHPPLYRPEFCSTIGPHIWPSISSYETPSPSSSPTLPIRKRYQGTSELVEDTEEESLYSYDERDRSEDEGPGLEEGGEEATPEGQQQAVLAEDTTVDEPLGLGYGALRCRELSVGEGKMPTTFEVGQSSRSVSEHDGTERISAFRQPTLVTWVDPEDGRVYTDILTYVLPVAHVHTPPSLEWSSGSLPVSPSSLAVPTSKENHDLRMQIAKERSERLELIDRVARMERRHESRGE